MHDGPGRTVMAAPSCPLFAAQRLGTVGIIVTVLLER
jgi:hypothetical protein